VKLAEQGATVLAAAAIREAADLVGSRNVYFLCLAENRSVLDAMGLIPRHNVFTIPSRGLGSFVAGAARAVASIRRAGIEAAIDLEFFSRASAVFAFLSGASTRVGFCAFAPGAFRGGLHTHPVLWNPELHVAQNFLNLVRAAGTDPGLLPAIPTPPPPAASHAPTFQPSAAEEERVCGLLGAFAHRPLLILNPNAGDLVPQRRWPASRYVELGRRLLGLESDAAVVFTGNTSEAGETAVLAAQVGSERCLSVAGKTSFRELLALYSRAEVLVTNDSGPAHFASLTPISVVALFGPETPRVFGPLNPSHRVLWTGLACSPCVSPLGGRWTACRDNRCLQTITVDQVVTAVSDAIRERRSARGRAAS
jgi:ADP-heptose:LPS heptosyltransferase